MQKKLTLLFVLLLIGNSHFMAQSLTFKSITCNSQTNPVAIDSESPSLSWIVEADGFNRAQTAYQVLVGSLPELLNEEEADLWNSGKVVGSQSIHVAYKGKQLIPTHKYCWKVKIWDEQGRESEWSAIQTFEMGLMDETNWGEAQWICLSQDTRTSEHRFRMYQTGRMGAPQQVTSQPVGYFRNEWNTTKPIKSARAYICGLGYYELYINGEKTGDHVLDPAPSNYDKQAYYVSYDVTEQLKAGKNAIGMIVGNGFYGQNISWKRDPASDRDLSFGTPAARLLIKVTYSDDTQAVLHSDETWKNSTGPIVFDNIYGGDTYDARFEMEGWNTIDYDDSNWANAASISPEVDRISVQEMPPIRKLEELLPQRVFESPDADGWIVDFGQNMAGWVQITVTEKAGQVIDIIPTEALTQRGDDIYPGSTGGGANGMPQCLTYICKGGGAETWEPKFSYHGFRYVKITGLSSKPDSKSIKAILVATDVAKKGSFICSDPLLNKMDTISRWTIVSNLHGIPEDCPHREKCGWLGDAHAFCEYALYNYEMANFYQKYMEDIRTQMRQVNGGNNPEEVFNVPTMIAPGKRTSSIAKLDWGIATMYLPWYNYLYYGDSSIVTTYYEDMKGLTDYYLSFKDDQGIIQNGMGDWCPPRWDRRKNPVAMECDPIISANAYFFDILGIMESFAEMNGDLEFQQKMKVEKQQLLTSINNLYLQPIPLTTYMWYGSQTATVMALQFGMVPEVHEEAVIEGLAYNINAVKGGHHSTGIHGNRYIYTVLSKYGKQELAHQILTTPTFPSQAYIANYGFTTWPERQFYWEEMSQQTNSLNHPMHSGFAAFFYETLGGIKATYDAPGYKQFTVDPVFPEAITHASVTVPTPYGSIFNNWEINESNFSMNLQVPFNTEAKLAISAGMLKTLTLNGEAWDQFQQTHTPTIVNSSWAVLGSGNYHIEYVSDQVLKPEPMAKPVLSPPAVIPPAGRIAIVADGNSPDPDDLGGSAVSLALLRAAGLEDRLVHYSYCCDLERSSRISEEAEIERHALMQSCCEITSRRWGGFDSLRFYDALWQKEETIRDLSKAINTSTADNPLWIIEAGEPDIIGFALEASNQTNHRFVKVVTHHPANDNAGDFYTWQQILDFGVEEVRIPDQNTKLKVEIATWDWAKNHPDSRVQQVWLQGKIAEVDNVVRFQKGKWDCSDAGMVLYWITGATNGGLRDGTVDDVKTLLLEFIEQNPEN